MKKILLVLPLLLLTFAANAQPRIISVTGEASFEREADMIEISFNITNLNNTDLHKAKKEVDQVSQNVIAALVGLGVSEKDIYSPDFLFHYEQQTDDDDCLTAYLPEVDRGMWLRLRDIELYATIIDTLLENGVTKIDDVRSELSDFDEQKKAAMLLAIKDAKDQATFYVENFGATLGKVHRIGKKSASYDGYGNERIVVMGTRNRNKVKKPYSFKPNPVDIEASVYVEFEIE